jgi:hypothetical protein
MARLDSLAVHCHLATTRSGAAAYHSNALSYTTIDAVDFMFATIDTSCLITHMLTSRFAGSHTAASFEGQKQQQQVQTGAPELSEIAPHLEPNYAITFARLLAIHSGRKNLLTANCCRTRKKR